MIRSRGAFAPVITLVVAIIGMIVANTVLAAPTTGAAAVVLTPVQRALIGMFQPVGQLVTGVMELGQSREEANALRVSVDQLNAEVVRLREAEIENERLRAMLDFRRRTPQFQLTAAQIVALDPSSPVRSAWIDKGANAGFKVGMVALSPAGNLVGRITHVTPTTARVLYIVDTSSSVNAMIQRADSRALGLLTGLPGDRLQVRYLNQQEDIKVGDIVITSGIGETYPRGLYVGKIIEVRKNAAELFQEARVDPAVRFSRLDSVQIITNFLPTKVD